MNQMVQLASQEKLDMRENVEFQGTPDLLVLMEHLENMVERVLLAGMEPLGEKVHLVPGVSGESQEQVAVPEQPVMPEHLVNMEQPALMAMLETGVRKGSLEQQDAEVRLG